MLRQLTLTFLPTLAKRSTSFATGEDTDVGIVATDITDAGAMGDTPAAGAATGTTDDVVDAGAADVLNLSLLLAPV
jgi:hypothetical protein